jgi:hypothetical protein
MAVMVRWLSPLVVVVLAAAFTPVGSAAKKPITITVESHVRVSIPFDLPPKGKENKGDYIKYQDLLLNTQPMFGKKKGIPVGWDKGTLTYTSATDARLRGQAHFPGHGSIKFRGIMKPLKDGSSSVKIVGGGGKFLGARGVLIIGPGNTSALNTFRFTLPDGPVA